MKLASSLGTFLIKSHFHPREFGLIIPNSNLFDEWTSFWKPSKCFVVCCAFYRPRHHPSVIVVTSFAWQLLLTSYSLIYLDAFTHLINIVWQVCQLSGKDHQGLILNRIKVELITLQLQIWGGYSVTYITIVYMINVFSSLHLQI